MRDSNPWPSIPRGLQHVRRSFRALVARSASNSKPQQRQQQVQHPPSLPACPQTWAAPRRGLPSPSAPASSPTPRGRTTAGSSVTMLPPQRPVRRLPAVHIVRDYPEHLNPFREEPEEDAVEESEEPQLRPTQDKFGTWTVPRRRSHLNFDSWSSKPSPQTQSSRPFSTGPAHNGTVSEIGTSKTAPPRPALPAEGPYIAAGSAATLGRPPVRPRKKRRAPPPPPQQRFSLSGAVSLPQLCPDSAGAAGPHLAESCSSHASLHSEDDPTAPSREGSPCGAPRDGERPGRASRSETPDRPEDNTPPDPDEGRPTATPPPPPDAGPSGAPSELKQQVDEARPSSPQIRSCSPAQCSPEATRSHSPQEGTTTTSAPLVTASDDEDEGVCVGDMEASPRREECPAHRGENSSRQESPTREREDSPQRGISPNREEMKPIEHLEKSPHREESPHQEESPRQKESPRQEASALREESPRRKETPHREESPSLEATSQRGESPCHERGSPSGPVAAERTSIKNGASADSDRTEASSDEEPSVEAMPNAHVPPRQRAAAALEVQ